MIFIRWDLKTPCIKNSEWTQSLILHQMLTFPGATDFGNIEGNRFFIVISNNHER